MNADSEGAGNRKSRDLLIQHWIKRGVELQNATRFESALSCFVTALELNPDLRNVWYKVGNCWQNLGLLADAIASYNACDKRSQTQQDIWLQAASQFCLGQCYVSLQQQDNAISAYSLAYQFFSQFENNPHIQEAWDYLNRVGNSGLDQQNYQASIQYYQRLLKLVKSANNSQHLGGVLHGLGRGFSGDGLDELALECYQQMLDISRDLSDWEMEGTALYWLAWESWKLGKLADAIAYYEGAIAVYEKQEEGKGWVGVILNYLVDLYQKTGEFEKAIAVLEKRLAILRESQDKSGEYGVLYQIGGIYYNKLKDCDRAFDYYQSALEVAQGWTEKQPEKEANAYYMLGLISDTLNQSEDAISYFEEAIGYYEQDQSQQQWFVKSLDYIEKLSEKIGDSQKLIAVSEKRLILLRKGENKSGEYSLVYKIAGLYYKQKNYSRALDYYQSALEVAQGLTPRQPGYEANAYYMLGVISDILNQSEDAISYFEEAIGYYEQNDSQQQLLVKSLDYIEKLSEKIGDSQKLITVSEKRLILLREGENKSGEYGLLYKIARLYHHKLKDYSRAFDYYHLALEVAQGLTERQPLKEADAYYMLGVMCELLERLEDAVTYYREALKLYTDLGNQKWVEYNSRAAIQKLEKLLAIRSLASLSESDPQRQFLLNVLQTIADNKGDAKVVDPLLKQNLDKLDENFTDILRTWATAKFKEVSAETATLIAQSLIAFGNFLIIKFPLERRADNQEIAIACYEATLEVYTRTASPKQWALKQNLLAIAYNDRIGGERAENIEKAIACSKQALEVITRTAYPEDWADTHNLLASAYRNRIWGKKAENIEMAIACYEAVLEVRTRTAYSEDWATTQNLLAIAYYSRIRGEKAENIEMAIACSKLALEVITRTAYPEDWADTQNLLAIAYYSRIRGEKAENIEMAIACYEAVLEVRTRSAYPEQWATTQNLLAIAYCDRIRGERAENIEMAIACCEAALEVRTRTAYSEDWAMTQYNLAIAYCDRIRGERAENLEMAIACYKATLEIYTCTAYPEQWAMTQNNLASAYLYRIRGERAENLEIAIACYQEALEVRTRTAYPEDWATTQNNLANAYNDRIRGERAENLEMAIACYQAALEVRTRTAYPQYWADTQNNLGTAYRSRIRGERAENIEKAIACYQATLEVRTRTAYPEDWATTQNNLGTAYLYRIRGERANNIEKAIAYYQAALEEVHTRTAYPKDWAMTQNNLASAYLYRIRGGRADNIEKAINYYQSTLEVYTCTAYPEGWADTQNNLAGAYFDRIRGERAENLEIAIACCKAALEVRTRTAYPEQWAATQNNLAGIYCERIRGKRAENLEMAIACCKLALEVRTRQAFTDNYVETSCNLGLAYQQLQQWQLAYDTFYHAIETVEDIRAGIVKGGDADKQKLAEEWQKLYQAMVEVCIELKNYTVAIEYADRSKTRNLVELLATRDLYPKGNIPPEVLNELTRLRQEIETEQRRLEIEERSRDSFGGGMMGERSPQITDIKTTPPDRSHLNQLQQQLDDLIQDKITPIDPDFRRTQKVEPIPFAEIQALTGENTAILEWYILRDRFLVFIVTPPAKLTETDGEAVTLWQSSPEDYQQLIKWADDYLNAYQNRTSQDWKNSLISRLQKLGEILHINELMATIQKTAKKCDRLVLIPNRFLHLFPLHAIPISVSGGDITYLMDRFSLGVSYAPSCQLLQTANNRDRPNFSELFAIQNPTQDLEFTNLEVQTISSYFQPQTTLVKEQATKTELNSQEKTKLKTAHCHHFSCHGYFNFTNPLLSALLLANCYLQPPPSPIDRSRHLPVNNNKTVVDLSQCLTLGDVFTLDLRSCRLVTLSACETGLIDILSNSDEYIGLPSGFLVAGSTNVVSSLWAVSDISTALLMIRFYELLRDGYNVAIALNSAQKWLRNVTKTDLLDWIDKANKMKLRRSLEKIKDDKPFASPYYWGAFCAVGKF